MPPRVVAITGSAGKTTTKDAAAALLTQLGLRVHATAGNLNNAIGVPMVLLGLLPTHDVAIVEVGTNAPGEIAYGAGLCLPDVAVLTLVARAHAEGLGDRAAVAHEKGALLQALPRTGVAIVNGDDRWACAQLFRGEAGHCLAVGHGAAEAPDELDIRVMARRSRGLSGSSLTVRMAGGEISFETPLLGVPGAQACAMAMGIAAAVRPGPMLAEELTAGFRSLSTGRVGRLHPERLADDTILIDDAYNANGASTVASVASAIELAHELGRRCVLVLGEMLELGEFADEEHERVGEAVRAANPDLVLSVQGCARLIHKAAESANIDGEFSSSASVAAARIADFVRAGDLVLVKGSNGVGLGAVIEALSAQANR